MTSPAPGPWPPPAVRPGVPLPGGTWASPGYRSSGRRGTAVAALLAATVAADVAGLALDVTGIGLMNAAEVGTLTDADAAVFDSLYGLVALLQLGLFLASAVAVLAWLSRVVENVPPLTGVTPARSPRGAIGWWFVPFANLVIPYQVVRDTLRQLRTSDARPEGLVLAWWLIWIVGNGVSNATLRLPQDTIDELRTVFVVTAAGEAFAIVAGALLIVIVRAVEQRSATRAAALGLDRMPQPAWPAFASAAPSPPATGPGVPAGEPADPAHHPGPAAAASPVDATYPPADPTLGGSDR